MPSILVLSHLARIRRRPEPSRVRRLATPLLVATVVAAASVTAVVARSTGTVAKVAGEARSIASGTFQAGELGVVEAPLPAIAAAAQLERATRIGGVLGLATPSRRSATRIVDRIAARTYDEIAEYDARDRLISMQRFDIDGRLLAAVRFGWRVAAGAAIAESAARQHAEDLVTALGLGTTGTPRLVAAPSNAGWTVAWDRVVDGVPVPGDGLRIQLWPDGSVHGLTRSERALAARPATALDRGRAQAIVQSRLDTWFTAAARGQVGLVGAALAWVPSNNTFDATAPDAPGAVLRLAWVVRVTTAGTLSENLRALEVYVDASDGTVIGGDILR